MSSDLIRTYVTNRVPNAHFVPGKFSSDNAIGISILAARSVAHGRLHQCNQPEPAGKARIGAMRPAEQSDRLRGDFRVYAALQERHLYFTLKDETASIKTVMFRSQAQLLNFEPQNGMLVLVYGRATIYERDGVFQLYADYMKPFGAGAAQMAFDALYKKLAAEGLFAPERKRPLPAVPRCIGVVTSKTGAAWQDVQNVIARRWPMVKLLLAPVSVQGIEAEKSIVDGIRRLDRDPRPDLILVTRGGGSKEDLWVFNSERIARAAAACRRPVVSAVGHEIDTSILDYVADLRAPTPRPPRRNSACPIRGMYGRKYSFCSKIFKKIYRIAAIYAIIGLTSWPRRSFAASAPAVRPPRAGACHYAGRCRQAAQRHVQDARRTPAKRRCGGGNP